VLLTDSAARATRALHLVERPDAPQSELRVGHVGLPRSHPDYFPVLLMNAILGGLFSSRINLNLRERHAYTYGAHSAFEWRRGAGPFEVSTAVQSDVTAAAAREILHEIDTIRSTPVGADELELATSYLAGVFPIKYETTEAVARALAAMVVFSLPANYFDRYRDQVRAVTAADVRAAAEQHLRPDALQLVVVGDAAAVRGPLDALAFGPVIEYGRDGAPRTP
jgi:zinc protease